jgi:hypothetical protein
MNLQASSASRKSSRIAWIIFSVGIAFAPLAWIVWLGHVGPSWWMAYTNGGAVGHAADRVKGILCSVGILFCMIAPFFSAASLRRKILFSILGAVAGFIADYASGFIMIFFVVGV